jgi:hypothetical protein
MAFVLPELTVELVLALAAALCWIAWLAKYTWRVSGRSWLAAATKGAFGAKEEKPLWETLCDDEGACDFVRPRAADDFDKLYARGALDDKVLLAALLKRAIADIPLFQKTHDNFVTHKTLYETRLVAADVWARARQAKQDMDAEYQEVRRLAALLRPGWEETIFKQAGAILRHEQMEVAKQQQAADVVAAEEQRKRQREAELRRRDGERRHALHMKKQKDAQIAAKRKKMAENWEKQLAKEGASKEAKKKRAAKIRAALAGGGGNKKKGSKKKKE